MPCAHETFVDGCPDCVSARTSPAFLGNTLPERGDEGKEVRARGAQVGRYVLLDRVGRGGMGYVFAAYDPELDRKVAIKLLRPRNVDALTAFDLQTRLLREAQAMARLSDPHVVPVFDVGTFEAGVFLAMEFVEGTTLSAWMRSGKHTWREVVDKFRDAGSGLAAAHRAGLIHRDFKPSNVLVGADGRARVSDFGLARPQDLAAAPEGLFPAIGASVSLGESQTRSGPVLSTPLTQVGAIMGTPGYMAPEQYQGAPVSALTDQFSFCASLYEALYGQMPFSGSSVIEISEHAGRGEINPPPKDADIPVWLWRIVERGLQPDAAMRFPSMEALLAELSKDPTRVRRRLLTVSSAAVLVIAFAVGAYAYLLRASRVCSGAPQKLARVWDSDVSDGVHRALSGTNLPYAAATWTSVQGRLDAYASTWSNTYVDACEATRRRGEQSEQMLDLRMQCLDQSLRELSALTALLEKPDAKITENAAAAAAALPDLRRCSDAAALREPVPAPRDPGVAAQIATVEAELADADSLWKAGKYKESLRLAEVVVPKADAIGYPPLTARSYKSRADAEHYLKNACDAKVVDGYERAFGASEAAHLDDVAADSLLELAGCASYDHGRFEEARVLAELARAKLSRIPNPVAVEVSWHVRIAQVAQGEGKVDEAIDHLKKALTLGERLDKPLKTAETLSLLGWAYVDKGDLDDSRQALEKALSLREKEVGPDHPVVLTSLNALARQAQAAGNFEDSLAYLRRGIALSARVYGAVSQRHCIMVNNLANTLLNMGDRADEAVVEARKAFEECSKALGSDNPQLPGVRMMLGAALREAGHPSDALREHMAAKAEFERAPGKSPTLYCGCIQEEAADLLALGKSKESLNTARQAVRCMAEGKVEGLNLSEALEVQARGQLKTGDVAGAIETLNKTIALREAAKGDPNDIAESKFLLGQAKWKTDRKGATALIAEAAKIWEARGRKSRVRAVETWRATHH
jgi:eukaryotic-like serine/threonine-protein kinase